MKQAVTVIALSCIAILGVCQTPNDKGIPVQKSTSNTALNKKPETKDQPTANLPKNATTANQPASGESTGDSSNASRDSIEVERQLAKFTGYLAIVGGVQAVLLLIQAILFFQQKKIMGEHKVSFEQLASAARDNATAIKTQAGIMDQQLVLMNGQIAAIESQNRTMQESVAIAREQAEAGIEEKRARGKIGVDPLKLAAGANGITCWLENNGPSPAFVTDFRARLIYCLPKEIVPDYTLCRQILYSETILANSRIPNSALIFIDPDGVLNEEQIMNFKKGLAFVHFYGIAKYRDIFKRERETTIHMRWFMRWGGTSKGLVTEYWEPVGLPEENADK
jgi:hypothetical protein